VDPKKLEKFIQLLKKHDLAELEVESDDERVKIKAKSYGDTRSEHHPQHFHATGVSVSRHPQSESESSSSSKPGSNRATNLPPGTQIKSPLVGTYYGAPSPDAESFVKVGSRIKKGDTLCIVEAMKIMNEIEAEEDGIIKAVLVQNGEAVEYNQPLFVLE
jgi:acetyl-CoA carboxylase biotin carboxyl carrier protein